MTNPERVTRRTALGAGLALASTFCIADFRMLPPIVRRGRSVSSIDALLIDETVPLPRTLAAFVDAHRRTLPVIAIQLDAAGQAGLRRVLSTSHAIVGITSGATLFCLERIAWDQGMRLTARSQQCTTDPSEAACQQDAAAFLDGAHPAAASAGLQARTYRPSRADALLHAWVMQKSPRNV